jgi:alpha-ketoglutarate-dependent taurine dioxygenase
MANYTEPIYVSSLEEMLDSIPLHFSGYENKHVVVFRGANLSKEDQAIFSFALGDYFSSITNAGYIYPNSDEKTEYRYTEDHATNGFHLEKGPDEVGLGWHIEHPYFTEPIIFSTWNNLIFKCSEESGKTYFYDSCYLYSSLSTEKQDFLNKCVFKNRDRYGNNADTKIVRPHWLSGAPTIRADLKTHIRVQNIELASFDGRPATEDENNVYRTLLQEITDQVYNDEDNRLVHKWQQGDLVCPDMFKLYHAVTAGFKPEDRKFTGLWSYLRYQQ